MRLAVSLFGLTDGGTDVSEPVAGELCRRRLDRNWSLWRNKHPGSRRHRVCFINFWG